MVNCNMIFLKTNLSRIIHLVYTLLILISAIVSINPPHSPLNSTFVLYFRLDYIIHFAIFLSWMFLTRLSYPVNFRKDLNKALLWIFAGIAFACINEGIQYFIPYRAFNINDLLGNIIGVLLGSLFFALPAGRKGSLVLNRDRK